MKILEYPFDANEILSKKKIRRELLEANNNFLDKKIAILGGATTSNIKLILDLFLLNYGINEKQEKGKAVFARRNRNRGPY